MLIFTSLGMPLVLGEHMWVHLATTLIVMSGNTRMCQLSESEIPGSLHVFSDVVHQLIGAGEGIGLQSCVAVQRSLQALLGFVVPTVILFSWETVARDAFLGKASPAPGQELIKSVDWLMLPIALAYSVQITCAISLVVMS